MAGPSRLCCSSKLFSAPFTYQVHHRRFVHHSSISHRTLVGPPDPTSHIRPVIYEDDPSHRAVTVKSEDKGKGVQTLKSEDNSSQTHPYSLNEFDGDPSDYQWRLERKRLDTFNHDFWTDSNTRFENAKRDVLSSLPDDATPEQRETSLSTFYRQWLMQENDRLKEYSDEWRRRNFSGILLAARAAMRRFRTKGGK